MNFGADLTRSALGWDLRRNRPNIVDDLPVRGPTSGSHVFRFHYLEAQSHENPTSIINMLGDVAGLESDCKRSYNCGII